MECPRRKAATENSIGIVGTSVGGAPTSNAFLPLANTSVTTPWAQIRRR